MDVPDIREWTTDQWINGWVRIEACRLPGLIAAPLVGHRSLHQPPAAQPPCPCCGNRLQPGGITMSWDPDARRHKVRCAVCHGTWTEADPEPFVEALAAVSRARREFDLTGDRGDLDDALARCRSLRLDVPDYIDV